MKRIVLLHNCSCFFVLPESGHDAVLKLCIPFHERISPTDLHNNPPPPCKPPHHPRGGGGVSWPRKHKDQVLKVPKLSYHVILWYRFVVQSPPPTAISPLGGEPA